MHDSSMHASSIPAFRHYGQRFGSAVFFFRHGIALCHPAFGVLTLAAEVGDADDQAAVRQLRHSFEHCSRIAQVYAAARVPWDILYVVIVLIGHADWMLIGC